MLIFNTTYQVTSNHTENWIQWIKTEHIPFMMKSDVFLEPQISKIVGSEDESGTSFSVQFKVDNMDTLILWHKQYATEFQDIASAKFGTEVVFFSTVLELID